MLYYNTVCCFHVGLVLSLCPLIEYCMVCDWFSYHKKFCAFLTGHCDSKIKMQVNTHWIPWNGYKLVFVTSRIPWEASSKMELSVRHVFMRFSRDTHLWKGEGRGRCLVTTRSPKHLWLTLQAALGLERPFTVGPSWAWLARHLPHLSVAEGGPLWKNLVRQPSTTGAVSKRLE